MSLYDLAEHLLTAERLLEESEDNPDVQARLIQELQATAGEFRDKAENYGKWIKNLLAEAAAVKVERQRLWAREKTLTNRVEWIKGYLFDEMTAAGYNKLGTVVKLRVQKSPPSCTILDEAQVPEQYVKTVTETKVDKKAILAAWRDSGEIPQGCDIDDKKCHLVVK